MSTWNIYHKDGSKLTDVNEEQITVHGLEYSDSWMGECFVAINLKHEVPINFQIGDYIVYRGERFELNYEPGKDKQARPDTYGEGFVYDSVKFNALQDELSRAEFLDVVLNDNELHYTTLPKFPFYVQTLDDLLDRIQANLDDQIGAGLWKIYSRNMERSVQRGCLESDWLSMYGEGTRDNVIESMSITVDSQTCWQALALVNEKWNINFIVRGRNIYVGTTGIEAGHIFSYGIGNGLYEIVQNADSDQSVITRLRAYGSEKNLPSHYYADLGVKYVANITKVVTASRNVELELDIDYIETYFKNPRKYIVSGETGEQSSGWVLKVTFDFKTEITGYVTQKYNTNKCRFYSEYRGTQVDSGDEESRENLNTFIAQVKAGKTKMYITSGLNKKNVPSSMKEYAENLPNNMSINRLMLPGFPHVSLSDFYDSLTDEEKKYVNPTGKQHRFSTDPHRPYIDSINIDQIGIRSASQFFDTDDKTNGVVEIYPTIEEMVVGGVRVDEIDEGVAPDDDGRYDGDPGPNNVDIYLSKAVDFDIKDLADDDFSISMKDGMCGGRTFKVASSTKVDGRWRLTIERIKDDALELWFPYKDYPIKKGDHFVLTGITLPDSYVNAASLKLLKYAIAFIDKNDYTRYVYQPKVDEIFMARQHDQAEADDTGVIKSLHDTLKAGDLMNFNDTDLNIEGIISIDQLTIKEEDGKIPTYDITLREDKEVGTIQKIQQQISSIKSGNGGTGAGLTTTQVKNQVATEGSKHFISKINDDIAKGTVTWEKVQKFVSGLFVGNFNAENGGSWTPDAEGRSHLITDYLEVRMKAIFEELVINKTSTIGGKEIISPAGGVVAHKVEEVTVTYNNVSQKAYRCYFLAEQEGDAVDNDFAVGDQVRSESFNVRKGTYHKAGNHFYWRLVIGRDEDPVELEGKKYHYIDLSDTDCATASDVPAKGDVLNQCGNRTDVERQNCLIFSAVDTYSPSISLYHGINSYSFANKEFVGYGVNKKTNKAFFNVYGDMYVGDRPTKDNGYEGSSYVKYDSATKQVVIKGKLSAKSTVDGKELSQYIKENSAKGLTEEQVNNIINNSQVIADLQNQVDGAIETWFYDGVPTLTNAPASSWTTNKDKDTHLGDLYYDNKTGKAYRFAKDGNTYKWTIITDTDIAKALADASKAQETADGKMKVFSSQPTPPYQVGDIWVNATYPSDGSTYKNEVLRCQTDKKAGSQFAIADWIKASKYTDDTVANAAKKAAEEAKKAAETAQTNITNLGKTVTINKKAFDSYVKDGYLEPSEIAAMAQDSKRLEDDFAAAEKSYNEVKGAEVLKSTKELTDLNTAFATLTTAKTELVTYLSDISSRYNAADTNGKATIVSAVGTKFTNFQSAYSAFYDKLGLANAYITSKIYGDLKQNITDLAGYKYIKDALGQTTDIDGGLVMTTLLALRDADGNIQSGINGAIDTNRGKKSIATWWGGQMVDKDYNSGSLTPATSLVRFDGSGYLANGAIWWDVDGKVHADPTSFIISEKNLGAYLAFFEPTWKSGSNGTNIKDLVALTPQAPFTTLSVSNDLLVEGKLKIGSITLSVVNGALKIDGNVYSTGGMSAYGEGTSNGGGLNGSIVPFDKAKFLTAQNEGTEIASAWSIKKLYDMINSIDVTGQLADYLKKTEASTLYQPKGNYLTSHQDISGKSDKTHTHSVKINGVTKTIAATGGTAVDLGTYLTSHQSLAAYLKSADAEKTYSKLGHTHAFSEITGKPTTLAGYGVTDGVNTVTLSGSGNAVTSASIDGHTLTLTKGSTFSLSGHTHTFASLTSKPTTIAGYGITDAYTKAQVDSTIAKYLPLAGGTITGALTVNGIATFKSKVAIGDIYIINDGSGNLYVQKTDGKTAANFYATGGITAFGASSVSGGTGGGLNGSVLGFEKATAMTSADNGDSSKTEVSFLATAWSIKQLNDKINAFGTGVFSDYLTIAAAKATYQPKGNYLISHQTIYGLTIQKNGTSLGTYTPNSAAKTINVTVPTKLSELSNDSGYTKNTGTVTSVAISVPTGLSVSGSPITTHGTIAISLASGYSIPTTAKQTNWDKVYNWYTGITATDTDDIINKWQEVIAFLDGISSSTDLNAIVDGINTSISNEVTRAKSAESTLTTNLNAEITRAKGAESTLTTNLNNEITRAKNAENTLNNKFANYLPLAGGTMTGVLALKGGMFEDAYNGALNMQNSNIFGLNSIYTSDKSDSQAEGIHFYRDATHVDTLRMMDGKLLFTPNRELGKTATEYEVIHSGTIGNQSVNYAKSAGNADTLDNIHASGLFTALANSGNNISVTIGGTNKTLTVGYATKAAQLYTARTLWGNSFDGTANISGQITFPNVTSGFANGVKWQVGNNDYAIIRGGATGSDGCYLEIATADGTNEPIYVRQYSGAFTTIKRTLTLLDASGNTILPGKLNIGGIVVEYDATNKALKVNGNLYATGGITAYGEGSVGTTGSNNFSAKAYADSIKLTSENLSEIASAYSIAVLNNSLNAAIGRISTLEGGSATSIETTGSGNAVTSVSKSGTKITFTKGSTFSLNGHTHDFITVGANQTITATQYTKSRLSVRPYYKSGGPTIFGNILEVVSGNSGGGQLGMEWSGSQTKTDGTDTNVGKLYYRSKRDNMAGWTVWKRLAFAEELAWGNISGKPTSLSGYGITDGVNAVSVTGSGNAVTAASVSGHTLTLTKGSSFSLSNHTHYVGTTQVQGSSAEQALTGITKIDNILKLSKATVTVNTSHKAEQNRLVIYGTTYGNDANYIKSAGKLSYGDGGPQLVFSTSEHPDASGVQSAALVYTDHDTIGTGVSLSFVTNQGDAYFIAPHIKALTAFQGNLAWSYITNKPTTLSGFGITDGLRSVTQPSGSNVFVTGISTSGTAITYTKSYTKKSLTAVGASGWTNASTDGNIIPDMSFIAYWNGAYSGTSSNLAYCNKGAFGSFAIKNSLAFSELTSKPTTISGYGITDAYTKSQVDAIAAKYLPLTGGTLTGQLKIVASALNGAYNGLLIGDDCYIGDCNSANTIGFMGSTNNNAGMVKFGKGGMQFGYNGSNHIASTTAQWTNLNADLLDGWHKDNIVWSGAVNSNTASLSHYWAKLFDITVTGNQYDDRSFTFLFSNGYNDTYSVVVLRIRQNGAKDSGAYNFNISLRELVGNMSSRLRVYYNNATGNVQLWGNCQGQYGSLSYTIIKKTGRTSADFTSQGTLVTNRSFSAAQSLPATTGDSPYTLLDGATRIGIVKQADQLVTARSLWGQSFNGTANVSGNMTGVGNINTSAAPAGTIYTNNWFRSKGSTGWYSEDHGGGWYMSDNTWIRNFGSKDVYLSNKLSVNGNVGIGTTAPSHKLHVSGEIYTTTKVNINGIVLEKDSDGNLKVNGNLYATGGISAYGTSSAGSGGGLSGSVLAWDSAIKMPNATNGSSDTTKTESSFLASAWSIKQLYNKVTSLEGGSAMNVSVSGSGNAVTSISKSGTTISVVKGSTFSLSGHTHKWADITDRPSSLKNPSALSWSGYSSGSYDGSAAKSISIPNNTNQLTNGAGFITASASITGNAATATKVNHSLSVFGKSFNGSADVTVADTDLIASISTGTANLTDKTEILTSYASDNGFNDSNAKNRILRRPASAIWGYINSKTISNADKLDGVHASGLFTNLSNSGNKISITIGGTNKTLTAAYATNCDTLDGYHAQLGSSKPYGKIPVIGTDGVIELGHYIDFHHDNTTGSDYSVRLQTNGNHSNVVTLPTATGTLALTSDNVASATKLQTARTIWGQSFNGTANVSGALSGATTISASNTISTSLQNGALKIGNKSAPISAIDAQVIFNTGAAVRFGETAWNWNQWAGLKYTHSNKTVYLGIADGSVFNANNAQSGGKLQLKAIDTILFDSDSDSFQIHCDNSNDYLRIGSSDNSGYVLVSDIGNWDTDNNGDDTNNWLISIDGTGTFKSIYCPGIYTANSIISTRNKALLLSGNVIREYHRDGSPYYSSITFNETTLALNAYSNIGLTSSHGITIEGGSGITIEGGSGTISMEASGGFDVTYRAASLSVSQTGASEYTWTFNNGSIKTTGGITAYQSSDERLKHNIHGVDSLAIIKAMGGTVAFRYNEDDKASIGWIAQRVLHNTLMQDLVEKDEDGYLKINYWSPKLIAVAFGAIEQVDDEVAKLKARVRELENEVEQLKSDRL